MSLRLSDLAGFDAFDVEMRGGEAVGLTVVKKDGSRVALKQQDKPTPATSCSAGQTLSCWEDHGQQMCICVCVGGAVRRPKVIIVAADD